MVPDTAVSYKQQDETLKPKHMLGVKNAVIPSESVVFNRKIYEQTVVQYILLST